MITKRLKFEGGMEYPLAAYLELPDHDHPRCYALFAHCFTCTKNIKAARNISNALTNENIAVLRFDFTGLGESEGDFADTNFSSNIEDLVAAAQFLQMEYQSPQLLIGHSLGGAAVLQAAKRIQSCKAVVTIAAPAEPSHVLDHISPKMEQIEREGKAEVNLAGRTFTIKKQFLDDLNQDRMDYTIDHLDRALLIFHSPVDNVVGINNAAAIFQKARHPKSFISLDQADHLLMKDEDSQYVGKMISAWVEFYL